MKKYKIVEKNKVKVIKYNIFDKYKSLIAVHSTRIGGISKGYFSEMNLGFARGDKYEDVLENYKIFSEAIGVSYESMVLSDQCHNTGILIVDEKHKGMGITKHRDYSDIDGLITDKKNIPLVTFYADCTPIYFYDPKKEVIAMAHSGWRGTTKMISRKVIELFENEYNSNKKDILITIGPSICQSCYEVGEEVIDKLKELPISVDEFYSYNSDKNKYYIDLIRINKKILSDIGIPDKNIDLCEMCTKCSSDLLFSHRGHGNKRGTQIGVMMMK